MKLIIFLLSLIFLPFVAISQKGSLKFGVQYKPMINAGIIENQETKVVSDALSFSVKQRKGFGAGVIIRKGLSDMFSLESGLGYVRRDYQLSIDSLSGNSKSELDFRIIGYEIPLIGLVHIRLSKKIFMTTAFGGVAAIFPSDVSKVSGIWKVENVRHGIVQFSLLANLGWEFRTEKSGAFYLGASYNRSLQDMYRIKVGKASSAVLTEQFFDIGGNYLSLDFRYYFQENPKKEKAKKSKG